MDVGRTPTSINMYKRMKELPTVMVKKYCPSLQCIQYGRGGTGFFDHHCSKIVANTVEHLLLYTSHWEKQWQEAMQMWLDEQDEKRSTLPYLTRTQEGKPSFYHTPAQQSEEERYGAGWKEWEEEIPQALRFW